MRLLLASASPRRAELLAAAGYLFEVRAVDVDERRRGAEQPEQYVARLAAEKSARVMEQLKGAASGSNLPDVLVIGADTAVVVGAEILGKPRDVQDEERMLRLLSGRTHEVLTGLNVRTANDTASTVEATSVAFASLTEDEIAWYRDSGEGQDKAGGYAIQGLASRFVLRIEGSYSNVVGLPIAVLARLIRQLSQGPNVLASRGQ